jgi:hypothetical protein
MTQLEFNPGSFSDISSTKLAQKIWEYLNMEIPYTRLETASDLRRPALEPLGRHLIEEFGEEIKADRWKQMIGRMARQIMEHHGYSLDQTGVRIRNNPLFSSAARYKLAA